ncbi:hypothetical protein AN644_01335 [Candidatus Epulonipiscium fishelsonii]|nr:hypothetical protein AN644_01335 [Epulopiscium sp. SCG-C06WGA-EpuloA1]
MKKVYVIPTGDEINDGTVLDLDSGEIMTQILKRYPQSEITRVAPICDVQKSIIERLDKLSQENPSLIVLVGGSGGGHRHSESLGKDFTHSALVEFLDESFCREIYGKNGHLWSKLICGKKSNTTIINVPGPFVEAQVAIKEFVANFEDQSLEETVHQMALAVYSQYPADKVQSIKQ